MDLSIPEPTYFDLLKNAAEQLAVDKKVIFVGQAVAFPGTGITRQLVNVPKEQLLEMPVAEEFQAGFCLGLALEGYLPVCVYPRFNFAILACSQIFNHLDKWEAMSGKNAKVIIKVAVGSVNPLDPGHQHKADYTDAFRKMSTNISVVNIVDKDMVVPCYNLAYRSNKSVVVVEHADLYNN